MRSEEHTSELQSLRHLVCRPLLAPSTPLPPPLPLHDALPIWCGALRVAPELGPQDRLRAVEEGLLDLDPWGTEAQATVDPQGLAVAGHQRDRAGRCPLLQVR